ncbi:hypothetical protein RZ71_09850 [Apilactobacillus kunkeei]|uniref:Gram-positive cocci surface proteins LPxTG domain-containing protein n=1 Tax=Apilactobacillus kunkeei TaxID=148814 RepID=A0A0N0UVD6_9LACO|nr:hypothetical protein [Apilactobacillus kunkeei]KOY77079.1 hypothetical protein RZ71_09850 [Apilactobacillus kunkeei]
MDKKFKNMTLAIIPLSVMLMSAATNTYAKAATGVANGKSNEKDNLKKMSDKDLLAAANQIQNYLYGYYNESLGFVKGDYIKQLAQASLYDGDIQRQFANEIKEATKQTLADKAKDDSVSASNDKAQSDASKEVDYLNYMAKSLDAASDILSKNPGAKVEFDSLKKSIASDLDNLNDALKNVKDTDKHDKAKFEKAVTNLTNEIKTTEDHISKFDGKGYESTALSRLSHALDDQYNKVEKTLNDLINQEKGRTEDVNELINSDKMQEALDKALDDTKAKFEKSDAAKMSKVDKLLNDLIKRESQRTADVKALIESDKMKEALEDAFNKQVSDTKAKYEKSDAEKMDKVNKELDALINHEHQRTSDINDLIASDKKQEELEQAAQKKLDQQVADKKAKFEKEDAAKMAKVNKQLDDLLNHEKQRTSDVNDMIASDKMQEKLRDELNKAVSKTKAKFEKSDAAKMDKVNKLLDQLIKHEKQRSADVQDMIASDKMQEELQKEFNQAVADKKANLEKSDAEKMDRVNKALDALLAHEKQRTADVHEMIASDKMQEQLEKSLKKQVSDTKAKFEKDNNAKMDKVNKALDALLNHEKQRTSDIHDLIDSDKMQEQLEKSAQKAFKKQVADTKAKFEKEDAAKMDKVNKELDALLNHEKQRTADVKELINSDKIHDALVDYAKKVADQKAKFEKSDAEKMAKADKQLDDLINHEKDRTADIKDMIASDKMQDALEDAAQKAFEKEVADKKAGFEKSDADKMAEFNKQFDAVLNNEKQRSQDIKDMIASDKMHDALEDAAKKAFAEKVAAKEAEYEKADDAKMAELNKKFDEAIKNEKDRTSDIKEMIDADKMHDALEDAAKKAFAEKVAAKEAEYDKADDAKMADLNKKFDEAIKNEKDRTAEIKDMIASDKMQDALEDAAQKAFEKEVADKKAGFEKSDADKMAEFNKQFDAVLNNEKQRSQDIKDMIDSDKMHDALEDAAKKAFAEKVAAKEAEYDKADDAKMADLNKKFDEAIKNEKDRSSDIKDMIDADKMHDALVDYAKKVNDTKAKFEKDDADKMADLNKKFDEAINNEKDRTAEIKDMIASDKMQDALEDAAQKAFDQEVADKKAGFEKSDAEKMAEFDKQFDALLNNEKQRSQDIKDMIASDKMHDALEDAAEKAFAEKVAAKEAELEKADNAKMADFNNKVDNLVKQQSSKLASIYAAMHKVENKNDKKSVDAYNKLAKTLKSFVAQQLKNVNELNKRVINDATKKNNEALANFEKALNEAAKKANKKHTVKKLQAQPVEGLSFRMADEETNDDEYQFNDSSDIPNEYRDDYINHLSDLLGKSNVLDQESSLLTKKMDEINALKAKLSKIANLSDKEFTNSSELNDDLNALYDLVNQTNNSEVTEIGNMQTLAKVNSLVDDLKKNYAVALADYMVKPSDDSKANDDKKPSDDQKNNDDKKPSDDQKNNDDKKPSDDQKNNDDKKPSDDQKANDDKKPSDDQKNNDDKKPSDDQKNNDDKKPSDDQKANDDKKPSDDSKANDDKKPSDDQKANDEKKPSDDQKANDDKKPSDDQKANDDKKPSDNQKNNDDNTTSSTKIDGDKGNDSTLTPDVKPDQPAVNPSNKNNAGQPKKPSKKPAKKAPKAKKVSIKKSKKSLAKLNKKLKSKKMTKRAKKALLKKIHALKNKIKRAIVSRDKKKLTKINKKLHSKKISKKTRKRLHKQAAALRKEIKKNYVKPAKKKVAKKTVKKHAKKSAKKSKKTTKKSKKASKKSAKKAHKKAKKVAKKSKKAAKKVKKHQKKLTKRAAKKVKADKKAIAKLNKKLKSKHLTKKHRRSLIAKRAQLRKAVRKLTK